MQKCIMQNTNTGQYSIWSQNKLRILKKQTYTDVVVVVVVLWLSTGIEKATHSATQIKK